MTSGRHNVDPPGHGPAWQAAQDYGFDMSLVEANLALTHQQRIRQHTRALRMAQELKEGLEQAHERS